MTTFKTLDELNEFNKKAFQQTFSKNIREPSKNPFQEGTFESLKFNARPHEVFKLDWKTYNSIDFPDKFLPYIKKWYNAKGMWMYDGAELFNGLKKTDRKLFTFDNHKYLISLINYTYPKDVLAQQRKDRVIVNNNEVLTFIEVDENNTIDIHFKFGKRFTSHISSALENQGSSINILALENAVYKTDKRTFQEFFNKELVHYNMMSFILNTLGIEEQVTELVEYNTLFSEEIISFMENFTIAGKYKPYVFIEKTQKEVQLKTDLAVREGTKITPKSNEIYIWLVHKDTSFIVIQFGNNVARDLKEREITKEFLEQLVLDQINIEVSQNAISKTRIDTGVRKGLAKSIFTGANIDALKSNPLYLEIFNTNPTLYLALQTANFAIDHIENLRIKENRWDPRLDNYLPLIAGDTLFNAQICGLFNGIIDEVKAIPEMAAFFSKIFGSEKEYTDFVNGLKKLFDEGIIQAILEGATKEYKKALQEGNLEQLYYNLAHDLIQIVSLLIGVFKFVKGVSGFINFSKKGLNYIKRFGREGIDELKNLDQKQIKEVFDNLDKIGKNIDSVRLKKLELDEWKKVISKKGGIIKNVEESKELLRYFDKGDVGAAFNGFEIPPTIWIRKGVTDLELFHETMHFEDFLRRGKTSFQRGFERLEYAIGNKPQIPKRDQIINNYIKEKYVFDKILEEQEAWIKKFDKGRFTQGEIDFSTEYFSEYQIECILNGIDVKKIKLKE